MMAAAVNCLVKDARRKFVEGSMGCFVRRSVTPYPRRKTGFPLRMTRTAAPGALLDFRGAKTASMRVEETWAVAAPEEQTRPNSNAVASFGFRIDPRTSEMTGTR